MTDSVPISNGIASVYVIHQHNGNRYTRDGFNSKWRNAKLAAKAANPSINVDFTFHDLKAKGISDLKGSLTDKQAISGHKNSRQTAAYDRKVKIVPVVGNQNPTNTKLLDLADQMDVRLPGRQRIGIGDHSVNYLISVLLRDVSTAVTAVLLNDRDAVRHVRKAHNSISAILHYVTND